MDQIKIGKFIADERKRIRIYAKTTFRKIRNQ